MKIRLLREIFLPDRTIGKLWFGQTYVWTLEDAYREHAGVPVAQWKVPGKTAIPSGEYPVIIDFSQRFQREMPKLLNVSGFTGVRIHAGNSPEDTEGCILVGTGVSNNRLVDSRSAYNLVMDMLEHYYGTGQEITLEISGVPPAGFFDLPEAA